MMRETVNLPHYFKRISDVEKQLDPTNVKILSAMWRSGPRNLLEVSRRTGLPFTTVYHRVARLESRSKRLVYLLPETSRMGLVRVVVLMAAKAGYEDVVSRALKIPNFWRSINSCEGTFTHVSAHGIPVKSVKDFKKYVGQLSRSGLVKQLKLIHTADPIPNFPAFRYYDPKLQRWSFEWAQWSSKLSSITPKVTIEDPLDYRLIVDKRDLLIVKELEKNGRKSFRELAPVSGISLQAVKYRYDRLVSSGIIRHFGFDVYPYPIEISAYHEVMLQFTTKRAMNQFFTLMPELFFIHSVVKVLGENTLLVRTYIPESQLSKMFAFFSHLAKDGMLASYSSARLDFSGRQTQTISYELFDNEKGWTFDLGQYLSTLAVDIPQLASR